ncbi:dipeptidase PepE [Sediminicola arcticus]|jgi:dipeptidase E|uniref:Dipeptidase PepE n=1 Tax=Sediminicola arcticus TaxID=1574308 RepID=A0ABV2SXS6_9FLAO
MKKLLLASTSTLFGETYLSYLTKNLEVFFKDVDTITFVPYARPGGISHDAYTAVVIKAFSKLNKKVVGLHSFSDPKVGIEKAEAIFTGGGNTFLLTKQLHEQDLIKVIREKVENGIPYMGASAGSNIAGPSMQTTNDMPIVYPPSFETLGLVNFNLNPHYMDPNPNGRHNGESREVRIKEFHQFNTTPVVGLREGDFIWAENGKLLLKGKGTARIFEVGKVPYESENIPF